MKAAAAVHGRDSGREATTHSDGWPTRRVQAEEEERWPQRVQVVIDCSNPAELGGFWAAVLGYNAQDPPTGFDSWDAALADAGVPESERDSAFAVVDPDGRGPRIFFQRVPEPKVAKNRVHLDVFVQATDDDEERRRRITAEVGRLQAIGAVFVREIEEYGQRWVTMQDPEGNEFDVA